MGNLLYNILLVEDDKEIIKNLTEFLNNEGFVVNSVTGQKDALLYVDEHMQDVDIVLLDVSLEDGNGFAVCTAIKQNTDIPVIFLTASGDEYSVVMGLDMGADDYLTKPFGVMELISRVKALLRRVGGMEEEKFIRIGLLFIDDEKHVAYVDDKPVELTFKEYELLRYLAINQGIVLSRDNLMEKVWSLDYEGESRTLDVHIKTLRQKLGVVGCYIKTVRNVGYYLDVDDRG